MCVSCASVPSCLHAGNDDSFQDEQSFKGQEGVGRECPGPQRRRAGGHVRAGAQPALARADQGRHGAAEAATAHAQEPRLRRQLPHQARHPEGRAGAPEDGAAARGGQAGPRERQHAVGAGGPPRQVRGATVLRQDCDPRWAPVAGQSGDHQRHYHRQVGQSQELRSDTLFGAILVSAELRSLPA